MLPVRIRRCQFESLQSKKSGAVSPIAISKIIRDWRIPAASGYILITLTFIVLGGWSAIAKLDSAVIAPGVLVQENSHKSIQHLEGGIIQSILVREGQHVVAGEVLLRLDPTQPQAVVELQQHQLDGLFAQEARLVAERDQTLGINWPEEFREGRNRATVQQAIADQTKQFTDRQASLRGQIDLLES